MTDRLDAALAEDVLSALPPDVASRVRLTGAREAGLVFIVDALADPPVLELLVDGDVRAELPLPKSDPVLYHPGAVLALVAQVARRLGGATVARRR